MTYDEVPSVHPCVPSTNKMDYAYDYVEVVCDGRTHVNVCYRNEQKVARSDPHDCPRWHAFAIRFIQLSKGAP